MPTQYTDPNNFNMYKHNVRSTPHRLFHREGFRPIVMRVSKSLNRFVIDNANMVENEHNLLGRLMKHSPTFDR